MTTKVKTSSSLARKLVKSEQLTVTIGERSWIIAPDTNWRSLLASLKTGATVDVSNLMALLEVAPSQAVGILANFRSLSGRCRRWTVHRDSPPCRDLLGALLSAPLEVDDDQRLERWYALCYGWIALGGPLTVDAKVSRMLKALRENGISSTRKELVSKIDSIRREFTKLDNARNGNTALSKITSLKLPPQIPTTLVMPDGYQVRGHRLFSDGGVLGRPVLVTRQLPIITSINETLGEKSVIVTICWPKGAKWQTADVTEPGAVNGKI